LALAEYGSGVIDLTGEGRDGAVSADEDTLVEEHCAQRTAHNAQPATHPAGGLQSAAEFLQTCGRDQLAEILLEFGDGTDPVSARRVADTLCFCRAEAPATGGIPARTREFAALVARVRGKDYQPMHPGPNSALRVGPRDCKPGFQPAPRPGPRSLCHYITQPLVELYRGCMVVLKVS
jgi:hypothetical protein